jgi:tetratricopeptide (TPR) repeat protein
VRDDEARTLARTLVRDAMRAGEVALAMEAHVLMIVVEWRCDRATDALGHARICEAWVEENGELATRGQLHAYMGLLYARLGPLGEAIAHHERAVAITREMAVPSYLAITLDALAQALSLMGRSKMARKRSEEALLLAASHETSPTVSGGAWRTRASIELRLGHFHDALHALRESRRIGGSLTESALLGPPTDIYEALAWSLLGQWSRVGQIVDRLAGNAGLTLNQRANVARLRFLMGLGQGRCEPEHLRAAIALLADHDDLRFILMNWLAPTLPTAEGLALLDEVRAMAVPMNLDAHVLVSHLRGAQIAAATDPELAARHARRARELGGEIDLGTHTAADLPLQCSRAHFAAGEHAIARDLLQQGLDALHASARDHVPAEFRDGFLERNPINRELLALGARHGLRHGG